MFNVYFIVVNTIESASSCGEAPNVDLVLTDLFGLKLIFGFPFWVMKLFNNIENLKRSL
mgnify:CR=1 FL=1